MDRGADRASSDRWLAGALVAGNQEDDPIAVNDGAVQLAVNGAPRRVEAHTMQVDDSIWHGGTARQPLVPASV